MFPNVPTGVENWSDFSRSFEAWGVGEIGEMTIVKWSRFNNNFWDSNIREIRIPMCLHSRRGKVTNETMKLRLPENSTKLGFLYEGDIICQSKFITPFVYLTYAGFTWNWILFYLNSTVFYSGKGPWQRCGKYTAEFSALKKDEWSEILIKGHIY